ncbi:hypothetical protein EVAR_92432_1 [Eumeta japonica]|uniref:Uncharacterized protein n=1 Tax=Eumeta variegata TaxID=151549 RepID=A0A4C1T9A8_EUMVA|nr:hypothetical protein EVAR_92432_1 [Eumeta japonica]
MKHHARRLFTEFKRGLVDLSDEFRDGRPSAAVKNLRHRLCAPYDQNRQACKLPRDSSILRHRHESNTINPSQTFEYEKTVLAVDLTQFDSGSKNGPRHLLTRFKKRGVKSGVEHSSSPCPSSVATPPGPDVKRKTTSCPAVPKLNAVIDMVVHDRSARRVYVGGLCTYSCGMFALCAARAKAAVILFSWTAGVMYSTLFTMPYLLVAHYHATGMLLAKGRTNTCIGSTFPSLLTQTGAYIPLIRGSHSGIIEILSNAGFPAIALAHVCKSALQQKHAQ